MGIFSNIDLENKARAAESTAEREQAETEDAVQMLEEIAAEADQTKAAKTTEDEEAAKRKVHEEAEVKRKAEWEAKKQAREEAEIAAWEAAVAMDDNALIEASAKRIGDDAERITRRNLKQCVTEYVQMQCYEDTAFARQVMHPRKSMVACFRYVNRKATEFCVQELKDQGIELKYGESYGSDVPDDLCYAWAVEYFHDMDAPEDKREDEEEFVPKPYIPSTPRKTTKYKPKAEPVKPKAEKPAPPPKTKPADAQLSMFDLGVA